MIYSDSQFKATDSTLVRAWTPFGFFIFQSHIVTQTKIKSHGTTTFAEKLGVDVVGTIKTSLAGNRIREGRKPSYFIGFEHGYVIEV